MKSLSSDATIMLTKVSILSITGHNPSILGCCSLLIRDNRSSTISYGFLIIEPGPSILYVEELRMFQGQLFLLTTGNDSNEVFNKLLTTEFKGRKLLTTSKSLHSHIQAADFKTLKTNVISITAKKFKDPEKKA